MLGFLLTAPFSDRFSTLTEAQKITMSVVTDVIFSRLAAALVSGGTGVFLVGLWFAVPLLRRR